MTSTQTSATPMISTPITGEPSPSPVAPAWHTVVLLAAMLGFSLLGARTGNQMVVSGPHGRVGSYAIVMVFEWALVAFIWWGVARRGVRIADLVGGSWPRPIALLRDLGIAIGFLIVSHLVLGGIGYLLKASPNAALRNILPRSAIEIALWIMLSLTAGFCEELIFRGYFQRQFTAWTHAAAAGLVLQGIVFGLGHGYQGWKMMTIITVFGWMFGALVLWRRSLRPGMLAHFLQDGATGVFARYLMR
jgi:uncharacterized protein